MERNVDFDAEHGPVALRIANFGRYSTLEDEIVRSEEFRLVWPWRDG
jgi:hypothetical protein